MKCYECEKEYMGETVRFNKHRDGKHPHPAVTAHTSTTGHKYTLADMISALVKEDIDFQRKVKEAIAIHKKKRALNRTAATRSPPSSSDLCHVTIVVM